MGDNKLRAGILIVSETASRDPSTDKCGPILQDVFRDDGGDQWEVTETKLVPDSISEIQSVVKQWSDGEDALSLVITSGGTGFAVKDRTPEAVTPLIEKHAPGLVHGMLAASLAVTPFALMSRPVAGVRNKTLILTLPGSPKGAKENLQAVLKLLPHACVQAAGADSRAIHVGGVKKLEEDAGVPSGAALYMLTVYPDPRTNHSHYHHHHGHGHGAHAGPKARTKPSDRPQSNDPSAGPTRRHRTSPYPMLSVEEALKLIEQHIPPPQTFLAPVNEFLTGHVLAADVHATESVPAFRASIVDGYAIKHPATGVFERGTYPVALVSHAQPGEVPPLQDGQIARITTGAPLPPGATAVVMVEDTVLVSKTVNESEEKDVEILTPAVQPSENVREVGSDVRAGDVILKKGEGITAHGGELGLLASVGTVEVLVYRKPVVGVLSTGDEIVPHDRPGALRLGEVRDTNRPTLLTAARNSGFEAVDLGIASDKPGTLETTLRTALQTVDLIITTGGVSMGELDLLKPTLERSLGGVIHFGRVSMKPGKPTTFATVPYKDPGTGHRSSRVVFSLPGNPASAVVTFHLFVLPSLHYASGVRPVGLPKVKVTLEEEVRLDAKRAEYHRVVVVARADGRLYASSTGGQRSSRIGSFRGANGLLVLPAGEGCVGRGEVGEVLLMGQVVSEV
ncbi:molybdopterin biosynthesis protein MoeA [Coniosporium apollinis CBS 100218]|uniref:Molybdopterin biosynthesis protein MoeA n=1 Tax=Coniosporium apollinis (strain CBS 100218) TaxID=1168221 RepID=R7YGU1_CONA1|nr:molybdopterin biosynthesis protein MoeA [Coniosporium apollinis CBS 100218]EON61034.1 molybdopterin biosynthesis protein MoeA [Coniosporium apollinis CBS 100218]